ncbi:MAG: hypothetical protein SF187_25500 [Deltaproteobacteria bacterium]|nr:hypothetical protein [Deltaproteobacteria bacterium]
MSDSGSSFGGRKRSMRDVGGTSGGLGEFFIGAAMAAVGGYLLTNQVEVHTSFWRFGGYGFGPTLIPLLIGVFALFFNAKSKLGWVLTVGGGLFIFANILMNMDILFRPTSLFNTLLMLGLLAGGLGLVFKSLRPHRAAASSGDE